MSRFQVRSAGLADAILLQYPVHRDERGFFVRVLDGMLLAEHAGIDSASFVQESQSRSTKGVLRGLHGRRHLSEAKLVRCASGTIHDVIVDLRPWSPTFRQWRAFVLDDVDHVQLFIPAGFAHGFQVLSDVADIHYRMDAAYAPELDYAIRFDDPDLGVEWPLPPQGLSPRDVNAVAFREVEDQLITWFGQTRS